MRAKVLHPMHGLAQLGLGEYRLHRRRDAVGPSALALGRADEVLAHLDDRVRETAARAVLPHTVAGELAVVGLVLPDDNVARLAQSIQQRHREAVVAVPEDRRVPGARHTL